MTLTVDGTGIGKVCLPVLGVVRGSKEGLFSFTGLLLLCDGKKGALEGVEIRSLSEIDRCMIKVAPELIDVSIQRRFPRTKNRQSNS